MCDYDIIMELVEKARKAVAQVEGYTQEQADEMVRAVGKKIYDNMEIISEEAASETGMGTKEDKMDKHYGATVNTWTYLRGKASVGILEDDRVNNIVTIAKPMGVVAAVTPSTNPTTTAVFTAMNAIKGLNATVVAAHPRAKNCSNHCVALMREALAEVGAPVDLIQCIEEPTIELSGILMEEADCIVAVGGAGMVKAAYSHGRPAFGVGQGNVQCLIGEDYLDFDYMAENVVFNRCFDDGVPCTGDQVMYIPRKNKEKILDAMEKQGAYILEDEAKIDVLRERFFDARGINRDIVGKAPKEALAAVGVDIPDCRLLILELTKGTGRRDVLCREILFPIIRYVVYDSFDDAVAMAKENLLMEGAGHSSSIWSKDYNEILKAGLQLPVGRLMVEQQNGDASGVTDFNGLPPTMAIGCGTWGGNSICENLTYYHLLNKTKISYKIPNAKTYETEEEIWG